MSNDLIDPRAELTAPQAEPAELPVIESPSLSPAMAALAAIRIEPDPVVAPDPVVIPEAKPAEPTAIPAPPSATQRFRATASAQIVAARARMGQRNASMVAVALVATVAGGFGSVLAAGAMAHFSAPDARLARIAALNDSIARLEDDLAGLRGKVERSAELSGARDGETDARFERIEKAQAEPAARLAKLSEAVERLRNAHAALLAQASSNDVTGSIKPSTSAKKPVIVEGWTLKEVDRDAALIEGKRGLFETYVGDTIPGVGRVESFRKQDGHWVIVTAKGLIVSR